MCNETFADDKLKETVLLTVAALAKKTTSEQVSENDNSPTTTELRFVEVLVKIVGLGKGDLPLPYPK